MMRRVARSLRWAVALGLAGALAPAAGAGAQVRPTVLDPNLVVRTAADGLTTPVSLAFLGPGGARKFRSATVAPGSSQQKTVNLRAGTYLAICTVGDGFHLARGMLKRFTVGQSG